MWSNYDNGVNEKKKKRDEFWRKEEELSVRWGIKWWRVIDPYKFLARKMNGIDRLSVPKELCGVQ